MKTCANCRATKPLEDFPFRDKAAGTYRSECKACMRKPLPVSGPVPLAKRCNRCVVLKQLVDFHAAPRGKYGRTAICKDCRNTENAAKRDPEKQRAYYQANREKTLAYQKARREDPVVREADRRRYEQRQADPEVRAANVERARLWREAHPWKRREHTLNERYGITPAQLDALVEAQGGGCAICKLALVSSKTTHIDHDHACCPGKKSCGACVRGVLCHRCNLALGMFDDDPARLRDAAAYLDRRG